MFYPSDSVILAPLSGFTDLPYRRSARRFGAKFAFTEMVDAGSLVFGNEKTDRFLTRGEDEAWLGVQLIGSEPELLAAAVEIINRHQFDVLDFNLGCPVPKVVKKGEGAALGRDPDRAAAALAVIVRRARIPVTAKIRILSETDPNPTIGLARKLADAGARALAVHGRVQAAFYAGPVFHAIIAAVREAVAIPVIANGGVTSYQAYRELRETTGCTAVMLARGAMGNPWLFREITAPGLTPPPTVAEFAAELETHVLEIIAYYGEDLGSRVARKIILDYLRGRGFPGTLKNQVAKLLRKSDFLEFMKEVREGPSSRYWTWLRTQPQAERALREG